MSISLADIRIVLIETSHPGNIGAAARAMKNMGLSRLYLVRPHHFPHADATARASGADDLLAGTVVCGSLDEALAECSLVFGASARLRALPWPHTDPRGLGGKVVAAPRQQAAVVFGREHSGLTNEELERCNFLVHIPTNPDFSSLNLAAAVQVIAYELRCALADVQPSPEPDDLPATAEELEGLYAHLQETLVRIGFLNPENPRHVMRRLRRLFNRADLERTEVNILRGVLSAADRQRE